MGASLSKIPYATSLWPAAQQREADYIQTTGGFIMEHFWKGKWDWLVYLNIQGLGVTGLRCFNHCSLTPPKADLYSRGQGVLEEKVFFSKLHCLEAKANMDHIQLHQFIEEQRNSCKSGFFRARAWWIRAQLLSEQQD